MRYGHLLKSLFFCGPNLTHVKVLGSIAPVLLLVGACAGVSTATQLADESEHCDYTGKSGMCIIFEDGARRLNGAAMEAAYLQAKHDVEERYGIDLKDVRG